MCLYVHPLIFLSVFFFFSARRQGLTPDNEIVEKNIADLSAKLDVYDKILSKQKYLAGDVSFFLQD